MPLPVYTIGHSTRGWDEFVGLLGGGEVSCLADVRAFRASKRHPQFNQDVLATRLAEAGIQYEAFPGLGGRRKRSQTPEAVNGFWVNQSFQNYADYALTPEFDRALQVLISLCQRERCAIMCAEAVWWRCHRRIIADYLLHAGVPVFHILGKGQVKPAQMTPGAVPSADGKLTYPA